MTLHYLWTFQDKQQCAFLLNDWCFCYSACYKPSYCISYSGHHFSKGNSFLAVMLSLMKQVLKCSATFIQHFCKIKKRVKQRSGEHCFVLIICVRGVNLSQYQVQLSFFHIFLMNLKVVLFQSACKAFHSPSCSLFRM